MTIRLLHLIGVIGLLTVCASIGGVFATYWVIEDEVQDLLDDDLEAQSELLAQLLATEDGPVSSGQLDDLVRAIFEPDQEETLWINVYDPRSGRHVSNLDHSLPIPEAGAGPVTVRLQGFDWFGYQHARPGGPVVQLLHRRDRYQEVREEVLEGVLVPALAVSAVNLLLLVGLTYLFLAPLRMLARNLESRESDALGPVMVTTPAHEIAVLRDAVNELMREMDAVLKRERAFASDVAHELRTPLTTLKLELSSDAPDSESLRSEVDRLIALVQQLLTLSRLQRTQWRETFQPVDITSLYDSQLRELESRLTDAGVRVEPVLSPACVRGDPVLLQVLLRNLLDNVCRHGSSGIRVEVRLADTGSGVLLQVADEGPGLDAQHREHLNQGLTRLDNRAGSGRGLAICRKITDVHGATLRFVARRDGRRGLEVQVRFPAPGST